MTIHTTIEEAVRKITAGVKRVTKDYNEASKNTLQYLVLKEVADNNVLLEQLSKSEMLLSEQYMWAISSLTRDVSATVEKEAGAGLKDSIQHELAQLCSNLISVSPSKELFATHIFYKFNPNGSITTTQVMVNKVSGEVTNVRGFRACTLETFARHN